MRKTERGNRVRDVNHEAESEDKKIVGCSVVSQSRKSRAMAFDPRLASHCRSQLPHVEGSRTSPWRMTGGLSLSHVKMRLEFHVLIVALCLVFYVWNIGSLIHISNLNVVLPGISVLLFHAMLSRTYSF